MTKNLLYAILFISLVAIWSLLFFLTKSNNARGNRIIIITAISRYKLSHPELFGRYQVDYLDMEDYGRTVLRFWDWGYRKILPRDKLEIIKCYINEKDGP